VISVPQESLSAALNAVTRVSLNHSLPIFSLVRLDASPDGRLSLSCFNGETASRATLYANCDEELSACVDAQTLKAITDTLNGELRLTLAERTLRLESGSNLTRFRLVEEDLPVIGEEQPQPVAALPGSALRSLGRALPFASHDIARPSLNVWHLSFSENEVVARAADGYCAGRASERLEGPKAPASLALPLSFGEVLIKLVQDGDTVKVGCLGGNRYLFEISDAETTRQLSLATVASELAFPAEQIEGLLATARREAIAHLELKKKDLDQMIRMVKALGAANMFIKTQAGVVKAASGETESGQARNELDGTASGEDAKAWLSAAFLKRAVEACHAELTLHLCGDQKPLIVEEGSFTALIMPIMREDSYDPFAKEEQAATLALPQVAVPA
jgi:DNA polymerase III sliding clamp (beta) subunit (PCNA family)